MDEDEQCWDGWERKEEDFSSSDWKDYLEIHC